jgi:hypothetical protein
MANPFPFVAGEVLTAADMNGIGEWTSYTPVLTASVTNPTLGTGSSQVGSYARIQNLIIYRFRISFGTSGISTGSGTYRVSLPVAATGSSLDYYLATNGQTSFFDSSASTLYFAQAWIANANYLNLIIQQSFNGFNQDLTSTVPVTVAASDTFSGLIIYQAA